LGKTKKSMLMWKDLKETLDQLAAMNRDSDLYQQKHPENVYFDWRAIQGEFGEEEAFKVRQMFKRQQQAIPIWDHDVVNAKLQEYWKPRQDLAKDCLIELMPEIKELMADLKQNYKLLKTDKYGDHYNWRSFEHIDEYLPVERDRIIQEIEEGYFDVKYKLEMRELEMNTVEDTMTFTRKKELAMIEAIEGEVKNEADRVATVEDPRKAALNALMKEVQEQHTKNKALESEIVNLKTQVEAIMAARAKAERARLAREKGKKKKEVNPVYEAAWVEFLTKNNLFVEDLETGGSKIYNVGNDGTKSVHPDWIKWQKDKEAARILAEQQALIAKQLQEHGAPQ